MVDSYIIFCCGEHLSSVIASPMTLMSDAFLDVYWLLLHYKLIYTFECSTLPSTNTKHLQKQPRWCFASCNRIRVYFFKCLDQVWQDYTSKLCLASCRLEMVSFSFTWLSRIMSKCMRPIQSPFNLFYL